MPKRVLGNISNNIANVCNLGTKRVAENSPQPVKRTRSQLADVKINHSENELVLKENQNVQRAKTTGWTPTIETKVRNINLRSDEDATIKEEITVQESASAQKRLTVKLKVEKSKAKKKYDFSDPLSYYEPPCSLPHGVADFDKSHVIDVGAEPQYAFDVFEYYKQKELECKCDKYMEKQEQLSKAMRAVLVDWLVEVQESFELNHETLYLAVKIVDHYLMKEQVTKARFQLLGATAILIAAKYDERLPPCIDDFLYICDDAYTRVDVIRLEIDILKKLNFSIGFPLSYRFLRRYSRCIQLPMDDLTLARYILEMSLMEYDLITERDSLLAAAALLLAFKMKRSTELKWNPTLEFYSGYKENELTDMVYKLNDVISSTKPNLKTIKAKYSHKIFYEVAKISPLPKRKAQNK